MWKQKYPAGSSAAEITRYRTGNTHSTVLVPCQICQCSVYLELSGTDASPGPDLGLEIQIPTSLNYNCR